MAKLVKILKAKVIECGPNNEPSPNDIKNGYKWILFIEDEKRITATLTRPDIPSYKSAIELKPGTYYLEANIGAMLKEGRLIQWTHILRVHEAK